MIINQPGAEYNYEGAIFRIGAPIVGISEGTIDEWQPDFALFTQILRRIDEVDGRTISWK